ncbi:MAG: DUF1972 domain-containing protein [Halioglobus sp.]
MKVAIVGTVGVPAQYGGFETLAENLVIRLSDVDFIVYCSSKNASVIPFEYENTERVFWRISANGISSILYDLLSIFHSLTRGVDAILILGVSGAIAIPIVRAICPNVQLVTNIDGIEWKREKWGRVARVVLRSMEFFAVRFSNIVVSDNQGISDYVRDKYSRESHTIAYGGDQIFQRPNTEGPPIFAGIPDVPFALSICRIERENNVSMILSAFAESNVHLVFIGNWKSTEYGRSLLRKYKAYGKMSLIDPIYDLGCLLEYRQRCCMYVHGHSAGGTNPSLVEAMHVGKEILAFNCLYNKYTLNGFGSFFSTAEELKKLLTNASPEQIVDFKMQQYAQRAYSWYSISQSYRRILMRDNSAKEKDQSSTSDC